MAVVKAVEKGKLLSAVDGILGAVQVNGDAARLAFQSALMMGDDRLAQRLSESEQLAPGRRVLEARQRGLRSHCHIRVDRPARVHRVWVMNADGSAPRQVTFNTQGYEHSPAFAPDGKSVVFAANTEDNDDEIYLLRLDSRKPVRLTHHAGVDTHPRFSPDGKNIVFVSINKGVQQIVVMDVAGGNIVPLTQGPDDAVDPVWVE